MKRKLASICLFVIAIVTAVSFVLEIESRVDIFEGTTAYIVATDTRVNDVEVWGPCNRDGFKAVDPYGRECLYRGTGNVHEEYTFASLEGVNFDNYAGASCYKIVTSVVIRKGYNVWGDVVKNTFESYQDLRAISCQEEQK